MLARALLRQTNTSAATRTEATATHAGEGRVVKTLRTLITVPAYCGLAVKRNDSN